MNKVDWHLALLIAVAFLDGCGGDPTTLLAAQSSAADQRLSIAPSSATVIEAADSNRIWQEGGNAGLLLKRRAGSPQAIEGPDGPMKPEALSGHLGSLGWERVMVPGKSVDRHLAFLAKAPSVLICEPNWQMLAEQDVAKDNVNFFFELASFGTPNDPLFSQQYAPQVIEAPSAWLEATGKQVVLAIADSGVDPGHPDLKAHVLPGWNTISDNNLVRDAYGHGTLCSGVAAAIANNGVGIVGIAPDAAILPVKVLGLMGIGSDESVAAGICWATDHGARVISLSLGNPDPSTILADAVTYALGKGVSLVAAMGNDGTNTKHYPAAFPGVIAVGATDAADRIWPQSQFGDWISVTAPGADILGTMPSYPVDLNGPNAPQGYARFSGTSLATPAVSATVALIRAMHPDWSPSQVKAQLEATCDRVGGQVGFDQHYGHGRLNALKAVTTAL